MGGQPLIERALNLLRELVDDLLIVTNDLAAYAGLGVRLVPDVFPGAGALGGIYSGLQAAQYERALVVGCDMPFLRPGPLRYLVALAAHYTIVMPCLDTLLEPLHAVYGKASLEPMRALVQSGDLRIRNLLSQTRVRLVRRGEYDLFDPHHLSLFNVNSPEDLAAAEAIATRLG